MERQRIIEILEVYRPGEGLETDPEVRQALELATQDPELAKLGQVRAVALGRMLREPPLEFQVV